MKLGLLRAAILAALAITLAKALATHEGVGVAEYAVGIAVVLVLLAWAALLVRAAAARK
jgi:hypothetical protein